jgi:hypothetical protein
MSSKTYGAKHGVNSITPSANSSSSSSALEKNPSNDPGLQKKSHSPRPRCQLLEDPFNGQFRRVKLSGKPYVYHMSNLRQVRLILDCSRLTLDHDNPAIFLNKSPQTFANTKNTSHPPITNAQDDMAPHQIEALTTSKRTCIHPDIAGRDEPVAPTNDLRLSHQLRANPSDCPACGNLFVSTRVTYNNDPRSITDNGVLDPFSSLPFPLNLNDQRWLHECKTTILDITNFNPLERH